VIFSASDITSGIVLRPETIPVSPAVLFAVSAAVFLEVLFPVLQEVPVSAAVSLPVPPVVQIQARLS